MANSVQMNGLLISLSLLCFGCAVEQPKSARTVAAYEVPLPTASDKRRFLALLTDKAEAAGFHVDSATDEQLKWTSEVFKQTFFSVGLARAGR